MNKKISFSETNKVHLIHDNFCRNLSSSYYRGIVQKCTDAHKEIFSILNRYTGGGFVYLDEENNEDKEDPLKIYNSEMEWDDDDTPIMYLKHIKENPPDIIILINNLERFSNENKIIVLSLDQFFQNSFLKIRMSGNSFVKSNDFILVSPINIYLNKIVIKSNDKLNNIMVSFSVCN